MARKRSPPKTKLTTAINKCKHGKFKRAGHNTYKQCLRANGIKVKGR